MNSTNLKTWTENLRNATTNKKMNTYRKLRTKIVNLNADIEFNQHCLKNNLTPKYASNSLKNFKGDVRLKQKLLTTTIKWQIDQKYGERDRVYPRIMFLQLELLNELHYIEYITVEEKIQEIIRTIKYKKRSKIFTKLGNLHSTQAPQKPKIPFAPRVINLTDMIFTQEEINLLNQGIKFCPPPQSKKVELTNLAIEINAKLDDKNTVQAVTQKIEDFYQRNVEENKGHNNKILKNIRKKLNSQPTIVTKADKSNALVILNENEYNKKIETFLASQEIREIKHNPTKKIDKDLRTMLHKSSIIENPKHLIEMNPKPPKIQGYIKIHKANEKVELKDVPIRPVVPTCSAPTYKTEKHLVNLFRNHVNWKPEYTVRNSLQLVEQLKEMHIPKNASLVSLDVNSMYTNVDRETAIKNCEKIVKDNTNWSEAEIHSYIQSIKFTLNNNYFEFKGRYYSLSTGLAMGAPLSSLLSDIFMEKYDTLICQNKRWSKKVHFYKRYVDDTLIIWLGTRRELDLFMREINNIDPKLTFSVEWGGKHINFLDISIKIIGEKLEFGIYRKDSYTDVIIPSSSYHSWSHKMSSFHALINRLINLPLKKEEYNKELNTIIAIAVNNGYQKQDIMRILHRKRQQRWNKEFLHKGSNYRKTEKWISIPFSEEISEKAKKIIKNREGTNVTFNNQRNLGSILINTKKQKSEDKLENSGVYEIECSCGKKYIGQTGRTVRVRTKEHMANTRLQKRGHSSISDHLINDNHDANLCSTRIIHVCKKGRKLNLLEQMEINKLKHTGNLLNTQQESQVAALIMPPSLILSERMTPVLATGS